MVVDRFCIGLFSDGVYWFDQQPVCGDETAIGDSERRGIKIFDYKP